jgi:hypothetical protein
LYVGRLKVSPRIFFPNKPQVVAPSWKCAMPNIECFARYRILRPPISAVTRL